MMGFSCVQNRLIKLKELKLWAQKWIKLDELSKCFILPVDHQSPIAFDPFYIYSWLHIAQIKEKRSSLVEFNNVRNSSRKTQVIETYINIPYACSLRKSQPLLRISWVGLLQR